MRCLLLGQEAQGCANLRQYYEVRGGGFFYDYLIEQNGEGFCELLLEEVRTAMAQTGMLP